MDQVNNPLDFESGENDVQETGIWSNAAEAMAPIKQDQPFRWENSPGTWPPVT